MISRIVLLIGAATCVTACATAHALSYPVKPVRLIAPFTAGGPVDVTARTLAQKLTDARGQQIVVENRAGASSTEAVANTPAQFDAFQKAGAARWAK